MPTPAFHTITSFLLYPGVLEEVPLAGGMLVWRHYQLEEWCMGMYVKKYVYLPNRLQQKLCYLTQYCSKSGLNVYIKNFLHIFRTNSLQNSLTGFFRFLFGIYFCSLFTLNVRISRTDNIDYIP
jgi:hypothetical protein